MGGQTCQSERLDRASEPQVVPIEVIGYDGIVARVERTVAGGYRVSIWIRDGVLRDLDQVADAIGAGRGEAVRVLLDMSGGNFRNLRRQAAAAVDGIAGAALALAALLADPVRRS